MEGTDHIGQVNVYLVVIHNKRMKTYRFNSMGVTSSPERSYDLMLADFIALRERYFRIPKRKLLITYMNENAKSFNYFISVIVQDNVHTRCCFV